MSFLNIDTVLVSRIMLAVFLHFVWQAAVICVFVISMRSLMRHSSSIRYLVLVGGLLLTVTAPLVTAGYFMAHPSLVNVEEALVIATQGIGETSDIGAEANILNLTRAQLAIQFERVFQWFENSSQIWLSFWIAGFLVLAMRLVISFDSCLRLRRLALPLPGKIEPVVDLVKSKMNISKRIMVRASEEVTQAIATGIIRPMVLIPAAWLTQLPTQSIEAIIAHELAHIRRFDLWVNLLQRVTETLFFYHPMVWWLSGKINVEREICCDELAIRCTGDRLKYAETLAWVAEMNDLEKSNLQFGTAFCGEKKMNLLRRVRMVLEPTTFNGQSILRLPVVLFGMTATLTFVSFAFSVTASPVAKQDAQKQEDVDSRVYVVRNGEHVILTQDHPATQEERFVWRIAEADEDQLKSTVLYRIAEATDDNVKAHSTWVQKNEDEEKSNAGNTPNTWRVELQIPTAQPNNAALATQLRKIADQLATQEKKGTWIVKPEQAKFDVKTEIRDVIVKTKERERVGQVSEPDHIVVQVQEGAKTLERIIAPNVKARLKLAQQQRGFYRYSTQDGKKKPHNIFVEERAPHHIHPKLAYEVVTDSLDDGKEGNRQIVIKAQEPATVELLQLDTPKTAPGMRDVISDLKKQVDALRKEIKALKSDGTREHLRLRLQDVPSNKGVSKPNNQNHARQAAQGKFTFVVDEEPNARGKFTFLVDEETSSVKD